MTARGHWFEALAAHGRPKTYWEGDSMVSIADGKRAAVDGDAPGPVRGASVVFHASQRCESECLKRVVGLPRDRISSDGTDLRVKSGSLGVALARHSVEASEPSLKLDGEW